jgi:hypothetical protein
MLRSLVPVLLIIRVVLAPASAQESDMFTKFPGQWSCKGTFANGAPIAADMSIEADQRSGTMILRHDDVPPGAYHSFELWAANKSGTGARAAISDKYSGMRWLESPGWVGSALTWTRFENGIAVEGFAYEFKGEALQVEWSVVRSGVMKVGDTLLCRRR